MDVQRVRIVIERIAIVLGMIGAALFVLFIAPVGAPRWVIIPSVTLVVVAMSIAIALQATEKELK